MRARAQSATAVVFAMAVAERQAHSDPAARRSACVKTLALLVMLSVVCASLGAEPQPARLAVSERSTPLPQRLSETGLYVEGAVTTVRAEHFAFVPQYPLWSDGATKRRWINLPPGRPSTRRGSMRGNFRSARGCGRSSATSGASRRASSSDWPTDHGASQRTCGTRRAPTRCSRRRTVRAAGQRRARRCAMSIPSRTDCRACHEGAAVPVLGFSALQLSPDRDPLAPHAEPARHRRRGPAHLRRARTGCATCRAACRNAAAHRGGVADRARGARLPARQLRPLPQRRPARCRRSIWCWRSSADRPRNELPSDRCGRCSALEPLSSATAGRRTAGRVLASRHERAPAADAVARPAHAACRRWARSIVDADGLALIERWINRTSIQPQGARHEAIASVNQSVVTRCSPLPSAGCASAARCRAPTHAKPAHATNVARGKYLVTVAGCNDCHTPWKMGPTGPSRT